jgi:hypothetical protein
MQAGHKPNLKLRTKNSKLIALPGMAALSALLLVLAFGVRPSYRLAFGSPTDAPLIDGFWNAERTPPGFDAGYTTFRWTEAYSTVLLRDIGPGPYRVDLRLNATRPPEAPSATLKLEVGGSTLLETTPVPSLATYSITVPQELITEGDLLLGITASPFRPPGDSRDLGIIAVDVTATPLPGASGPAIPPWEMLLGVVGAGLVVAALLMALGWGVWVVILGGVLPALFASALLIWDRLWLATREWYADWLPVTLGGALFALVVYGLGEIFFRGRVRWSPGQRRAIVTIAFAAFVVRLAGEMHPQIFIFDLGYHVNRLSLVRQGQLLFSTSPAEFGGFGNAALSTFYLPTAHLATLPLEWLLGGDTRTAIRALLAAAGTLGVLPLYYLAARMGRGRAGVIAAFLYVTLPVAVLPYSWGILPNVFGELLALVAMAALVTLAPHLHPRRPQFWLLTLIFSLTLLGHPGVVFLFLAALGLLILFWLAHPPAPEYRNAAVWTSAALGLSLLITFALYYHHFAAQLAEAAGAIVGGRGGGEFRRVVGGSVEDAALGLFQREVTSRSAWVWGGLEGFWREGVAYFRAWPLFAAAPLGFALARRRGEKTVTQLAFAWGLTVLLFAFVAWLFNVYVRYMLFALPIAALGTGLLLSSLWGRGRPARLLTTLTLAAFTLWALSLWGDRITYGFK